MASLSAPPADPYGAMPLSELPDSPDPILEDWLPPNEDPVRPAMTVATVDADGGADARTLLLSEWGPHGFAFHTDARSRKTAQLAGAPGVALVLGWPELRRQLVVRGPAREMAREEALRAYRLRDPYLQRLAWLNDGDFAQRSYPDRVAEWSAHVATNPAGLEAPPTWVGYLVRPTRVTFWSGSPETASRRIEYARDEPDRPWRVSLLAG